MNNIKKLTSNIQKKNKSLKLTIEKKFPIVVNAVITNMIVFYSYYSSDGHNG